MIALLLLLACKPVPDAPPGWALQGVLHGDAENGYGHALAFVGAELAIGVPFGRGGLVLREDGGIWVSGAGQDLLGSGLAGGERLLVGVPRRSRVVDAEGAELLVGAGSAPVHHAGGVAAIGAGGAVASDGSALESEERLWSLVSWRGALVAGRVSGGLVSQAGPIPPPAGTAEYGRALAACDLDGDGEDELLVGAPVPGEVHVLRALDHAPIAVLRVGGGRGGHAIACAAGEVWVGAPESGDLREGAIAWFDRPLESPAPAVVFTGDAPGARLGFALAIQDGAHRLAASAPGAGQVRLFVR